MNAGEEIDFVDIIKVAPSHMQAYSEASGDHNEIHLSDEVAKKAGLPGIIAHGMLIAGLVASRANQVRLEHLGSQWKFKRTKFRFRAMTFPDEKVQVGGKVKEADESHVVLMLTAKNEFDETKVTAQVTLEKVSA